MAASTATVGGDAAAAAAHGGDQQQHVHVIALVTCGRIAPCFGPAVGGFLQRYRDMLGPRLDGKDVKMIAYRHGFRGLLRGDVATLGKKEYLAAEVFSNQGGSPIGASRTRLTNRGHLRLRGLIRDDEDPHDVAAKQLIHDGVTVLHVIGSADAQVTAHTLSRLLFRQYNYTLHVVGLAKTIENDMWPLAMTLGAQTAAAEGAAFFENVVAEHNSNPRMLIIHEIKGRAAGWLTAATAREYRHRLDRRSFPSSFVGQGREVYDVHAVYTPEMHIDFSLEIPRLKRFMDRHDTVNVFVAQGTAQQLIERELKESGKAVERHPVLGYAVIDTAAWLAGKLKSGIGAEKVLIQRSGIYVRAAKAGAADLLLTKSCVHYAVDLVLDRGVLDPVLHTSVPPSPLRGVVGHDVRREGQLGLIEAEALTRKLPFDLSQTWFVELLAGIGQPQESAGQLRWRREREARAASVLANSLAAKGALQQTSVISASKL